VEPDPLLRRVERNAWIWCLGSAIVAFAVRAGRPDVALGVLAGGALVGMSYWAIKSSIDGLAHALGVGAGAAPARADDRIVKKRLVLATLKLVSRYALLGFGAYVMIARLRLHPVGLLIGASSIVAAATVEAVKFAGLRKPLR
jgi:hypothetical protein